MSIHSATFESLQVDRVLLFCFRPETNAVVRHKRLISIHVFRMSLFDMNPYRRSFATSSVIMWFWEKSRQSPGIFQYSSDSVHTYRSHNIYRTFLNHRNNRIVQFAAVCRVNHSCNDPVVRKNDARELDWFPVDEDGFMQRLTRFNGFVHQHLGNLWKITTTKQNKWGGLTPSAPTKRLRESTDLCLATRDQGLSRRIKTAI